VDFMTGRQVPLPRARRNDLLPTPAGGTSLHSAGGGDAGPPWLPAGAEALPAPVSQTRSPRSTDNAPNTVAPLN
jgi:hypothetical protein